jgi:GNAT superfamily N-acetyltransferase
VIRVRTGRRWPARISALAPLRETAKLPPGAPTLRAARRASITGAGRLVVTGSAPEPTLAREQSPPRYPAVAVGKAARGTGLGRLLVDAIEQREAERWLAAVELHALTHARGFYQQLGYAAYGDLLSEAGIEHISMHKELRYGLPSMAAGLRLARSRRRRGGAWRDGGECARRVFR